MYVRVDQVCLRGGLIVCECLILYLSITASREVTWSGAVTSARASKGGYPTRAYSCHLHTVSAASAGTRAPQPSWTWRHRFGAGDGALWTTLQSGHPVDYSWRQAGLLLLWAVSVAVTGTVPLAIKSKCRLPLLVLMLRASAPVNVRAGRWID